MRRQFRYQAVGATLVIASTALVCSTAAASSASVRPGAEPTTVVDSARTSAKGNVEVTVPPAIVSASDGLPITLQAGEQYQLDLPVWLAAGQPPTSATIHVVGAQVRRCGTERLIAGTIVRIHCRLLPTDASDVVVVRVDVHVRATNEPIGATFTHRVQARTTS